MWKGALQSGRKGIGVGLRQEKHPAPQAILAYLATSGESAVPRRRLARLLWSTRWEEQARASLRQSLMELRRGIVRESPELLRIERDRVCLQIDKVWVDGIDIPAKADRSVSPPQPDTDTFLESLRGVDAAFDHWLDIQLATFKATGEMDPDCGITSGSRGKKLFSRFNTLKGHTWRGRSGLRFWNSDRE